MVDETIKLVGYHGTLMERAAGIQNEGFHDSVKKIEWLGTGVYFFTEFTPAREWAKREKQRKNSDDTPVVLEVDILVPRSCFWDLDIPDTMRFFQQELQKILAVLSTGPGGAPKFKDNREARCFYCNSFAKMRDDVNIIAYSFPLEDRYDKFGFPSYRRQLCIKDSTCIKMPPRQLEAI